MGAGDGSSSGITEGTGTSTGTTSIFFMGSPISIQHTSDLSGRTERVGRRRPRMHPRIMYGEPADPPPGPVRVRVLHARAVRGAAVRALMHAEAQQVDARTTTGNELDEVAVPDAARSGGSRDRRRQRNAAVRDDPVPRLRAI